MVIEGRCGEGEQDELDFKLESVPLPGKRDPGHSSGEGREKRFPIRGDGRDVSDGAFVASTN